MNIETELIDWIEVSNSLGEGVVWRSTDQTVWWKDIQERRLFRMSWPECEGRSFELPDRLGSFGFVEGDDQWLVRAFELDDVNTSGRLSASYQLDLFGANAASRSAALADFDAAAFAQRALELTVQSDVATTYFNLLASREQLVVARQSPEISERIYQIVEVR